jgi:hypothetical protein
VLAALDLPGVPRTLGMLQPLLLLLAVGASLPRWKGHDKRHAGVAYSAAATWWPAETKQIPLPAILDQWRESRWHKHPRRTDSLVLNYRIRNIFGEWQPMEYPVTQEWTP